MASSKQQVLTWLSKLGCEIDETHDGIYIDAPKNYRFTAHDLHTLAYRYGRASGWEGTKTECWPVILQDLREGIIHCSLPVQAGSNCEAAGCYS